MSRASNLGQSLATRTTYSEGSNDKVLVVGPRRIKVSAIKSKVIEDINFLRSRIEKTKRLKTSNSTILSTYEEMLASREAILEWLQALDPGELNAAAKRILEKTCEM